MSADANGSGEAPLVVVRDLAKEFAQGGLGSHHTVRAVDGVSFEVRAGETFALVGESGSGKSTVSRMLLRLERPTAGTIEFAGRDVWAMRRRDLRGLRRQMQTVFQNPVASLNRRQTVEQIIAAPLEVHRVGNARERRRRVHELLAMVGLDVAHAGRLPGALSGGQCQRVAIARALALEPRLVVLDEAVSAVDVSIRAQILNLLTELQELTGVAYLFISHDLAVVRAIAPRLAVMQQGRVVEEGTCEEVFSAPRHPYTQTLLEAIPEPDPSRPFPLRGRFANEPAENGEHAAKGA
ncbi:MAG: ATP-binding cassette domain-containing protein [Solirubrobacterales bacterium]